MTARALPRSLDGDWDTFAGDWRNQVSSYLSKVPRTIDPLREVLEVQISHRIMQLQDLIGEVGESGLGVSDRAAVHGELSSLIDDLQALMIKVGGETTLAALQADQQAFADKGQVSRSVGLWVHLVVGVEKLIASGPDLTELENKIAGEIAEAPAVPRTVDAQMYLGDMKIAARAGKSLVAPLLATLLAITPGQLADGSANPELASITATLFRASWDLKLARWSAGCAEQDLRSAMAVPKPTATRI